MLLPFNYNNSMECKARKYPTFFADETTLGFVMPQLHQDVERIEYSFEGAEVHLAFHTPKRVEHHRAKVPERLSVLTSRIEDVIVVHPEDAEVIDRE